ncbi:MAG TPA: LacI family DNA-binding transcriptional regulator [Opitutales bacterium]|nr:LacI family DNA-binding transcriptional regulator [Opitutales bacterium]
MAKAAGVSVATASLALRNHASIPEATRKRVRKAAAAVDYRPNPRVGELMSHVRQNRALDQLKESVALYWADLGEPEVRKRPYLEDFEAGARESLQASGYGLTCFYQDAERSPAQLEKMLAARGVRGLLLAPLMRSTRCELDWDWRNFSAIIAGSALWSPHFNRVQFHHFAEMGIILDHLKAKGWEKIGLVIDSLLEERSQHAILGGFYGALDPDLPRRAACFEAEADDRAAFLSWLNGFRPDALIVAYPKALEWIEEAEASPHIVLRAVQEGPEGCAYPGINQSYRRLGQTAAYQLVGQLQRNEVGVSEQPLQSLIIGDWVDSEYSED